MREISLPQVQPDPLHGVELRRGGWERQQSDVLEDAQGPLVVPARLIENEHGVHIRRELAGEVLEEDLHRARVRSRQRKSKSLARAGSAGREQVQALVALIHEPGWAHAALVPDPRGPSFLPDARFVLAPDLETLARMLSRDSLKPRGELLFLRPPARPGRPSGARGGSSGARGRAA